MRILLFIIYITIFILNVFYASWIQIHLFNVVVAYFMLFMFFQIKWKCFDTMLTKNKKPEDDIIIDFDLDDYWNHKKK